MCSAHTFCLKYRFICLMSPVNGVQAPEKTLKDISTPRIQLYFLTLSQKIIIPQSSAFPEAISFILSASQLSFFKIVSIYIYLFFRSAGICFVLPGSSACLENFSEKEKLIFHCPVDLRAVISAKVSSCLLIIIPAIAVMCFPSLSSKVLGFKTKDMENNRSV